MAESWVTLKMSYEVNLHPELNHNRSAVQEIKIKDVFGQAPKKGKVRWLSVNNSLQFHESSATIHTPPNRL